ncbi:UNVERIFIED_CONTAM: hypothetical protein K2H54_043424 [Gekko kuhli]
MASKRPRDVDNINTPAPKQSKLEDFFPSSGIAACTAVYNVETTNRFTPLESLGEEGEEGGGIERLEGSVTSLRDSPQKVQCRVSGEEGKGAWDSLLDNQTTLIARTVRSIFVRIEAIANQVDQLRARMDDVVGLFQPKKCSDRDNGLRLQKLPQQIQTVVVTQPPPRRPLNGRGGGGVLTTYRGYLDWIRPILILKRSYNSVYQAKGKKFFSPLLPRQSPH